MLLSVLIGISIFFSVVALFTALSAVSYTKKHNKQSVSLREIAILSDEVTNLSDAYAAMLSSHKKLRSRIGMRDVRERRGKTNGSDMPDPKDDPEGWKRAMRRQLHLSKFGGKI